MRECAAASIANPDLESGRAAGQPDRLLSKVDVGPRLAVDGYLADMAFGRPHHQPHGFRRVTLGNLHAGLDGPRRRANVQSVGDGSEVRGQRIGANPFLRGEPAPRHAAREVKRTPLFEHEGIAKAVYPLRLVRNLVQGPAPMP